MKIVDIATQGYFTQIFDFNAVNLMLPSNFEILEQPYIASITSKHELLCTDMSRAARTYTKNIANGRESKVYGKLEEYFYPGTYAIKMM